jgi:hypothetical protein
VSKRRHGLQRCRYRGDDGMRASSLLGVDRNVLTLFV